HHAHERSVEKITPKPGFRVCESLYIFHWNVNPAACNVFLEIAKYISQLEGESEIDGILSRAQRLISEDLDAYEAHRRSDPIAIFAEIGEGLILPVVQVHLHSVDQIQDRLFWKTEFFNRVHESLAKRCGRPALEASMDLFPPAVELGGGV